MNKTFSCRQEVTEDTLHAAVVDRDKEAKEQVRHICSKGNLQNMGVFFLDFRIFLSCDANESFYR